MVQDLRFAVRMLNRQRAYALMAVLTVALGVGANTAVFSIADSVLFRPLPYPHSDRLFMVRKASLKTGPVYGRMPASNAEAVLATGLFETSASVSGFAERTYIKEANGLGTLSLALVPREYTEMLGRAFESSDAGTRAVLLSHRTWLRKYGGNPAVLDSLIQTPDRPPLHIVGIPPPRFRNPLLAGVDGLALLEGKFGGAPLLARLKPGVTPSAAVAQLNALRGEDLASTWRT